MSRWAHENNQKYTGSELNNVAREKLELLRRIASDHKAQCAFIAYGKVLLTISRLLRSTKAFQTQLKSSRQLVVDTILQVSATLELPKSIRLFGISRSTFQSWMTQVKFSFENSVFSLCRKSYPNQLSIKEVSTMKTMLSDPSYQSWPIVSICYHAVRQGLLYASPQTWYKYNALLGIRKGVFRRRNPHKMGIKADYPNQYWHADITIFKTLDGMKHYVYLVVDNYSRKILSWSLGDRASGALRIDTIEEAWELAIPYDKVSLIVDGGPENNNPENNNKVIDRFINSKGIDIEKKVALKDIVYSNSMVEATNKILKYRYLFPRNIADGLQLQKMLAESIHDFNAVRPHGRLGGRTPDEAYAGETISLTTEPTLKEKIQKNRAIIECGIC